MRVGQDFKKREIYNSITISPPFIARLDGWAFHTFTKTMGYTKPFDERLAKRFTDTATEFFSIFKPSLAYYFSDEISFLFLAPTVFDREEKLDSLMASSFTSMFSTEASPASFDCRVIPVTDNKDIMDYMKWRQAECRRNFLNGWAEKILAEKDKLSPARVAKALKGLNGDQLRGVCRSRGFDVDNAPSWQQWGVILYMETYYKDGFNPLTKETVKAKRRHVKEDWDTTNFATPAGENRLDFLLSSIKFELDHPF